MALRKENFEDKQQGKAKKRYRLTFDLTSELEERIKIAALKNRVSISDYLSTILEEAVPQENASKHERRPLNPEGVEELRRTREKIMKRRGGKLFEDSTEMIRQMREERTQYLMSRNEE